MWIGLKHGAHLVTSSLSFLLYSLPKKAVAPWLILLNENEQRLTILCWGLSYLSHGNNCEFLQSLFYMHAFLLPCGTEWCKYVNSHWWQRPRNSYWVAKLCVTLFSVMYVSIKCMSRLATEPETRWESSSTLSLPPRCQTSFPSVAPVPGSSTREETSVFVAQVVGTLCLLLPEGCRSWFLEHGLGCFRDCACTATV